MVQEFIHKQVSQGYMIGPLPSAECNQVTRSSKAVIPKKMPGKWRVIVDLSSPTNCSVNDSLRCHSTLVAYASVEDATVFMHELEPGTLLAKIDIRDAYRIIPMHPTTDHFWGSPGRTRCTLIASCLLAWRLLPPF